MGVNNDANAAAGQQSWLVEKTYSQFASMHELLVQIASIGSKEVFPRKHTFGCSGAKLVARRQGLEMYLQSLIACINEDIAISNASGLEQRVHAFLQKDREARAVAFGFLQFSVLLDSTPPLATGFSALDASAPGTGGYLANVGFADLEATAPP